MNSNKNQPLVSIIIPFYSGKKWLKEALESVYNQTYQNTEIILINDGSKEYIEDIIYENKSINYIVQTNHGAANARNHGIQLSKGQYIAFLDADDIWLKEKLEIQINEMLKYNSDWSHTSYIKFDKKRESIVNITSFNGIIFPMSVISNPIATPSVMIKKEILTSNIKYRFAEGLKYGEDTILWYKLSENFPILAIQQPLVKVRMRGTNASSLAFTQIEGRNNLWLNITNSSKRKVSIITRLGYIINAFFYKVLTSKFKNNKNNKLELISKCAFILPWMLFKIEKSARRRKY